MKLLLTNDDGYDQPGLAALYNAAVEFGKVVIVAPQKPHSCCGHQVTMEAPLTVTEDRSSSFKVNGTPADCVRLGIKELASDTEWVLAGINPGANLGSDIYQSGTVAAAREAAILSVNSVAISSYVAPGNKIDWKLTSEVVHTILGDILASPLERGCYLNINLPSPLSMDARNKVFYCQHDTQPHKYHFVRSGNGFRYTGVIHDRPYRKNTDIDVCFSGCVSVTRLRL